MSSDVCALLCGNLLSDVFIRKVRMFDSGVCLKIVSACSVVGVVTWGLLRGLFAWGCCVGCVGRGSVRVKRVLGVFHLVVV